MTEAEIHINGLGLTQAQVMAVRVAVTQFHMETGDPERAAEIGPIAEAYHKRLTEVLRIMLAHT